jgi:hypothetical protein
MRTEEGCESVDGGRPLVYPRGGWREWPGPRGNNIVKAWKEMNRSRHYANFPGSPDWPPIEREGIAVLKSEVKSRMCLTHDDFVRLSKMTSIN